MRIQPRTNIYGQFRVPGDKSITHRALILGSIAKGKTVIVNPLVSEDTKFTVNCLRKLGVKIKFNAREAEIKGCKKLKNGQRLECGGSGTTMRLLCGLIAGSNISASFYGDKSLSARPMRRIKEPLEKMGATVALTRYEVPPILVEGAKVRSIDYNMEIDSSQVKSAILLCAFAGKVQARITEKNLTRDHTEIMLKEMGADIERIETEKKIILKPSELKGCKIIVPGDLSSAAYFVALGLMLGRTRIKDVGINPTRMGFIRVLLRMGAKIEITNRRNICGEKVGDITAYKSKLTATHVLDYEIPSLIDEIPILAILMGVAEGESIISGAEELKLKESDRLDTVTKMINSLGGNCKKFDAGLVISGVTKYSGGIINSYGDHRIALSAAIGLTASENGGDIDGENCAGVSFPQFFEYLNSGKLGLIGANTDNSKSPEIHSFILDKFGLQNFSYTTINANDENYRRKLSELKDFAGYNVTVPFKNEIAKHLMKLKEPANKIKSVNTVKGYTGYSTDGAGFMMMLKYNGITVENKNALVLGCGGVGKSIIYSLLKHNANIDVYNRTIKTVLEFKKKFVNIYVLQDIPNITYDIVINTTVVGSGNMEDESLVTKEFLKKVSVVADVNYIPERTKLLTDAASLNKKILNGEQMLFFQAYIADCIYFKREISESTAFELYREYASIKMKNKTRAL